MLLAGHLMGSGDYSEGLILDDLKRLDIGLTGGGEPDGGCVGEDGLDEGIVG